MVYVLFVALMIHDVLLGHFPFNSNAVLLFVIQGKRVSSACGIKEVMLE